MKETVFGIYVVRHEGDELNDPPEDVGVILEGVTVLCELGNVPFALAILLALVYSLNLCYPPEHKYTFEALQKIILELNGNRISAKIQALKTILL
ncbi:sterile alpha motif domain-containing protein 3-like, partial [Silurus asotus]